MSSMIGTEQQRAAAPAEHSVGELVSQASEQLSLLVRQEMRLAQAELVQKGKRVGIGSGLFGGAALVGFLAIEALGAAAIAALALVVPVWAAALIVVGGLLALAGVLVVAGKGQLGRVPPMKPQQTIDSVKADIEEIKESVHTS
jgi:hypothetical protein